MLTRKVQKAVLTENPVTRRQQALRSPLVTPVVRKLLVTMACPLAAA